jgi:hypothetical protein
VGLGDETERARLLAAANAVILFRSPQPAELAALAGSERVAEAAWQVDGDDVTGRSTVTMRARSRVDQDRVRAARTGEAEIIAAGRVERARIIRTAIDDAAREQAKGLTAPPIAGTLHPPIPGPAVGERELPDPAQPRQGQAAPPSPPATLDPSGLARSGDTGRPGWARFTRPTTATPAQGAWKVHLRRWCLTSSHDGEQAPGWLCHPWEGVASADHNQVGAPAPA